jgi:hypothetical protein
MAIDPVSESGFPLKQTTDILPRRNGKTINVSTPRRWASRGRRGAQFETLGIGGVQSIRPMWCPWSTNEPLSRDTTGPSPRPPAEWLAYLQMAAMAEA